MNTVASIALIVVLGVGYYYQWRVSQKTHNRYVQHSGMDDLVEAVKELSKKVGEATDQLGDPNSSKDGR